MESIISMRLIPKVVEKTRMIIALSIQSHPFILIRTFQVCQANESGKNVTCNTQAAVRLSNRLIAF